jgi:hypothetical protein
LGLNRGAMKMNDDFDEPLPDEFWLGEERDPFDRLLIAQSQVERMTLATVDSAFDRCEIDRL